jgi:hypothetical protein
MGKRHLDYRAEFFKKAPTEKNNTAVETRSGETGSRGNTRKWQRGPIMTGCKVRMSAEEEVV